MDRVILHSDMNYFYANVECLYHPKLKNKPVAVCGDVEQRHGIVLTNLLTIPAHYDLYMQFSRAAREIYARYTDQIEPFGLDENWLDVSEKLNAFLEGKKDG